jgi:23S rRNA (uracil1939-C5)-methyltransferase
LTYGAEEQRRRPEWIGCEAVVEILADGTSRTLVVATVKPLRPGDKFEAACAGLDDAGAASRMFQPSRKPCAFMWPERCQVSVSVPASFMCPYTSALACAKPGAAVAEVLKPSSDRVVPICPAQGICGSCPLMILDYPAQLAWKRDRVMARLAEYPDLAGIAVEPCFPSPHTTGYRNQAKYVYGYARNSGRAVLGAYAPRSHEIVDLSECHVVEPVLDEVRDVLLEILVASGVEPFDEIRRTGILRYVVMRATSARRVLVTLVVARLDWDGAEAVATKLVARCPGVTGVVLNMNPTAGNNLFGNDERLLCGGSTVDDEIGDVRVRLSSRSFFQANREVASRIYRDLVAAVPTNTVRAVDVYAGAGGIALSLVPIAREIVAIEENLAATEAATTFIAEKTALGRHVQVVTGDAAACLASIDSADMVVLNPPRKGCAAEVLEAMQRLRPKVLAYLSCDPGTLARDLAVLVRAHATVTQVRPYDMMPHTPHVETLVVLEMR